MFSLQPRPLAGGGQDGCHFWRAAGISSTFPCSPRGRRPLPQALYWGETEVALGPAAGPVGAIFLDLDLVPPAHTRAAASPARGSPEAAGGSPRLGKVPTVAVPLTGFGQAPAPELSLTAGNGTGPAFTLEEPGHPAPRAPELRRTEPPKQGGSALRPCLPTSRLAAVRGRDPRQSQTGDGRRTAPTEGSSPLSASAGRRPGGSPGAGRGGGFLP